MTDSKPQYTTEQQQSLHPNKHNYNGYQSKIKTLQIFIIIYVIYTLVGLIFSRTYVFGMLTYYSYLQDTFYGYFYIVSFIIILFGLISISIMLSIRKDLRTILKEGQVFMKTVLKKRIYLYPTILLGHGLLGLLFIVIFAILTSSIKKSYELT